MAVNTRHAGRKRKPVSQRPATCWEKEPLIMDADRAAILLGFSPVLVRKLAREGKIPAHKFGVKLWRFYRDELRYFAQEGRAR